MLAYAQPSQSTLRPKATGMDRPGRAASIASNVILSDSEESKPRSFVGFHPPQDDRVAESVQKTSSGGDSLDSEESIVEINKPAGPQLGWPIVLSSTLFTTLLLWPFFLWGVLPAASLHWFIGSGIASLMFSVWKHEKAHGSKTHWLGGKGRWDPGLKGPYTELADDESFWQQQAKDGIIESGKMATRFFAITLGLFLFSMFLPPWLAKPLAELSAMLLVPTLLNTFFWFFSAFFGEDGLQASGLMPEAEQDQEATDRLIAELKELFKEDQVFVDAIDVELEDPETEQRLKQRLERGEPIWRYETAISYDPEQNRFKNNIDEFRPEFHDRPLTVEAPPHPMSRYYYLDADSDLAKSSDIGTTHKVHLQPKARGEKRVYIYHMQGDLKTAPIVDGIVLISRGSMEIGQETLKGTIVDTRDCQADIPLRVDDLLDNEPRRLFIRRINANRYTLGRLYDYKIVLEEDGWIMLEKQKRSFRPFSREKREAFEEILNKDSVYKWSCITDFFSMATNGVLAATLLPEIYKMAQSRFGILALALLAIRFINTIAVLIGQSHAGTRVREMENNLSRIEALQARGGGLGQAIKQEVDARIKRFHGGWWPLSILTQRSFFLLLYPFIFMFLWSSYPFAVQKAIFICIYIAWGIVGMGTAPLEEKNRYFLTEKAGGRGYFKDVRKEGLTDNFWRAQAFRLNLNMLIQFSALVVTFAILNFFSIGLIESWAFFGIFFAVALIGRPLLRVLIMPYGEDVDSKLIIYSEEPPEPKVYFAKGNIYERRFEFKDCGITISSDDADFIPERMRDYRLGNLYGVPLRMAEVLERLPGIGGLGLVDKVQRGRFRVDELYIIHDPDRLGISIQLEDDVSLQSVEGESHNIIKPVRREWNITRDDTRVVEVRQYLPSEHLRISTEVKGVISIGSEKATEDEAHHKKKIEDLVDEIFLKDGLTDNPLSAERERIIDALVRRSVVYIGDISYSYDHSSGKVRSDLDSFRKGPGDRGHVYIPHSSPMGLRGYNFMPIEGEDGVFSVYHYERPQHLSDAGFAEGVKVIDGKVRVSYAKASSAAKAKGRDVARIEILEGGLQEVPIERVLEAANVDKIIIDRHLAGSGIEAALPDFREKDTEDAQVRLLKRHKYTLLDRILLWRRAQRAKDQKSKNLKYGEMFGHLTKNFSLGYLIAIAMLVFRKMGEGIEKLDIEAFWRFAIFLIIPVLTGAFMSERTDKITNIEDSQVSAQQSRGDLGIDRKIEVFDYLKRGMGWSSIGVLFLGALLTLVLLAIEPLSAGAAACLWLDPGTAFVILGLSVGALEVLNWRIVERTWWKLLEDFVRNNPLLSLLGYTRDFFEYLGIGTAINLAAFAAPIGLFFFYGAFGIFPFTTFLAGTSGWAVTGLTPLGYGLSIAAILAMVLGRFVFPIYARFGGDSKLVIDVPNKDYIILPEEFDKKNTGTNGNGKTLRRRLFRFSDGLIVSTSDPKCFPMFSKLGSTRSRKRFVILDPEKYDIEYGYDEGIETTRYDSDKNPIARAFRRITPAKRVRILRGKRSQARLYDYTRADEEVAKSFSAGMHRRQMLKAMFLAGAGAVVASKVPAAILGLTTAGEPWQEHLRKRLKDLGYSDESLPLIEEGFTELLALIDKEMSIAELKKHLRQKEGKKKAHALFKLGALLNNNGYFEHRNPRPLLRNISKGLDVGDIYGSQAEEGQRALDDSLLTCTAISQLMYMLLDILEIDATGINPPAHALNAIKLDDKNLLLADFTRGKFFQVDTKRFYRPDKTGRFLLIRDDAVRPERREQLRDLRRRFMDQQLPRSEMRRLKLTALEACYVFYSEIQFVNEKGFSPHICDKLAGEYSKLGRFDEAIKMQKKAISLNSEIAELFYSISIYYRKSNRTQEAIEQIKKALEIKPHLFDAWKTLGSYYFGEKEFDKASEAYARASKLRPDFEWIYYEHGCALFFAKRYEDAIRSFEEAIRCNPHFAEAYFMMGDIYIRTGQDQQKGMVCLGKACKLNPKLLKQFPESDQEKIREVIEDLKDFPSRPKPITNPGRINTSVPSRALIMLQLPKSSSAAKVDWQKFVHSIPVTLIARNHYIKEKGYAYLRRKMGMKKNTLLDELKLVDNEDEYHVRKRVLVERALELTMGNATAAGKILGVAQATIILAAGRYSIEIVSQEQAKAKAKKMRNDPGWIPYSSKPFTRKDGIERRRTKQLVNSDHKIYIREFEEFPIGKKGRNGAEATIIWEKEQGHWVPVSITLKKGKTAETAALARVYDGDGNLLHIGENIAGETLSRLYKSYGRLMVVREVGGDGLLHIAGFTYYLTKYSGAKSFTIIDKDIVPLEISLEVPGEGKRIDVNVTVLYNRKQEAIFSGIQIPQIRLKRLCKIHGKIKATRRVSSKRRLVLGNLNDFVTAKRLIGNMATMAVDKTGIVTEIKIAQGDGQPPYDFPIAIARSLKGRIIGSFGSFTHSTLKRLHQEHGDFFIRKKVSQGGTLKISSANRYFFGSTLNGRLKGKNARCRIGGNGIVTDISISLERGEKPYRPELIFITDEKGKSLHTGVKITSDKLVSLHKDNSYTDIIVRKKVPPQGGFWLGDNYFSYSGPAGATAIMHIGENGIARRLEFKPRRGKQEEAPLQLVLTESGELIFSKRVVYKKKLQELHAEHGPLILYANNSKDVYAVDADGNKSKISKFTLNKLIREMVLHIRKELSPMSPKARQETLRHAYKEIGKIFHRIHYIYGVLEVNRELYRETRIIWMTAVKKYTLFKKEDESAEPVSEEDLSADNDREVESITKEVDNLENIILIAQEAISTDPEAVIEQEEDLRAIISKLRQRALKVKLNRQYKRLDGLAVRLGNMIRLARENKTSETDSGDGYEEEADSYAHRGSEELADDGDRDGLTDTERYLQGTDEQNGAEFHSGKFGKSSSAATADWDTFIASLPVTLQARRDYIEEKGYDYLRRKMGIRKKTLFEQLDLIDDDKEEARRVFTKRALDLAMGNPQIAGRILGINYHTVESTAKKHSMPILTQEQARVAGLLLRNEPDWIPYDSKPFTRKDGIERRRTRHVVAADSTIRIREFEEFPIGKKGFKDTQATVIWERENNHWVPVSISLRNSKGAEEVPLVRIYDKDNNILYIGTAEQLVRKTLKRLYGKHGKLTIVKEVKNRRLEVASFGYWLSKHNATKAFISVDRDLVPLEILLEVPGKAKKVDADIAVAYNRKGRALFSSVVLTEARLRQLYAAHGKLKVAQRVNPSGAIHLSPLNNFFVRGIFAGCMATMEVCKTGIVTSIEIDQGQEKDPYTVSISIVTDLKGSVIDSYAAFAEGTLRRLHRQHGDFFVTRNVNNRGVLRLSRYNIYNLSTNLGGKLRGKKTKSRIGNNGIVINIKVYYEAGKPPYEPELIFITDHKGKNLRTGINISPKRLESLHAEDGYVGIVVRKTVPPKGGFWLGDNYFYYPRFAGATAIIHIGENGIVRKLEFKPKRGKQQEVPLYIMLTQKGELVHASGKAFKKKLKELHAEHGPFLLYANNSEEAYEIDEFGERVRLSKFTLRELIKEMIKHQRRELAFMKSTYKQSTIRHAHMEIAKTYHRIRHMYNELRIDRDLHEEARNLWITSLGRYALLKKKEEPQQPGKDEALDDKKIKERESVVSEIEDLESIILLIEESVDVDPEAAFEQESDLRVVIERLKERTLELEMDREYKRVDKLGNRLDNLLAHIAEVREQETADDYEPDHAVADTSDGDRGEDDPTDTERYLKDSDEQNREDFYDGDFGKSSSAGMNRRQMLKRLSLGAAGLAAASAVTAWRFLSDDTIPKEKVEKALVDLGYLKERDTFALLTKEIDIFLSELEEEIGISRLKAGLSSEDINKKKEMLVRFIKFTRQKGYVGTLFSKPLMRYLVNGLDDEDIFKLLEQEDLADTSKAGDEYAISILTLCTAVSQLGYIIFDILDIETEVATAPTHTFNIIRLGEDRLLFVDLGIGVVREVAVSEYYDEKNGYLVLRNKEAPSERLANIREQAEKYGFNPQQQGAGRLTKEEIERLRFEDIAYLFYPKVRIASKKGFTPYIYGNLAVAYRKSGRSKKALAMHAKALSCDSEIAQEHVNVSTLYQKTGKARQGKEHAARATQLDPELADAWEALGVAHFSLKEYDESIKAHKKSTELNPNSADSFSNLGNAYLRKSRTREAIRAYKKALEIDPDNVNACFNLANIYGKLGNHSEAIPLYKNVIRLKPKFYGGYQNLGNSYHALGRLTEAVDSWARAAELNPKVLERTNRELRIIIESRMKKTKSLSPKSSSSGRVNWPKFVASLPVSRQARQSYIAEKGYDYLRKKMGMKNGNYSQEMERVKGPEAKDDRRRELVTKALELSIWNIKFAAEILGVTIHIVLYTTNQFQIEVLGKQEIDKRIQATRTSPDWVPFGSAKVRGKRAIPARRTTQKVATDSYITISEYEEFPLKVKNCKDADMRITWELENGHWVPVSLRIEKDGQEQYIGLCRFYDNNKNLVRISVSVKRDTVRGLCKEHGNIEMVREIGEDEKLYLPGVNYELKGKRQYKASAIFSEEAVALDVRLIDPKSAKEEDVGFIVVSDKTGKPLFSCPPSYYEEAFLGVYKKYRKAHKEVKISSSFFLKEVLHMLYELEPRPKIYVRVSDDGYLRVNNDNVFFLGDIAEGSLSGKMAECTIGNSGIIIGLAITIGADEMYKPTLTLITNARGHNIYSDLAVSPEKLISLITEQRDHDIIVRRVVKAEEEIRIGEYSFVGPSDGYSVLVAKVGENAVFKEVTFKRKDEVISSPVIGVVYTQEARPIFSSIAPKTGILKELFRQHGELIVCASDKSSINVVGASGRLRNPKPGQIKGLLSELATKVEALAETIKEEKDDAVLLPVHREINLLCCRLSSLTEYVNLREYIQKVRNIWFRSTQYLFVASQGLKAKEVERRALRDIKKRREKEKLEGQLESFEDTFEVLKTRVEDDPEALSKQKKSLRQQLTRMQKAASKLKDADLIEQVAKLAQEVEELIEQVEEAAGDISNVELGAVSGSDEFRGRGSSYTESTNRDDLSVYGQLRRTLSSDVHWDDDEARNDDEEGYGEGGEDGEFEKSSSSGVAGKINSIMAIDQAA